MLRAALVNDNGENGDKIDVAPHNLIAASKKLIQVKAAAGLA